MNLRPLIAPLALLALAACGGGSSGSGQPNGTVSITLGADSTPDWSQVVMGVEEIDASSDGTHWSAVATPKRTFDLLQLQGGSPITLASGISLPAGAYQFRLVWATTNYTNGVFLPAYAYPAGSATGQALTMPVSTTLPGSASIAPGQSTDLLVMLDTASAVQVFQGASSQTVFQPSPGVFDSTSCSIAGVLKDSGGQAIPGAEVFAEIVDGTGSPHLVRRAFTDAGGAYRLDGLPAFLSGIQASYYLVAMPGASGGSAYPATAAGPLLATGGAVLQAPALATAGSPLVPGELDLNLSPDTPTGQGTLADLRQNVSAGGSSPFLIVRADAVGTVLSSGDAYAFRGLPPGSYGVNATRYTPGGAAAGGATSPSLVVVNGGATTTVNLQVQ